MVSRRSTLIVITLAVAFVVGAVYVVGSWLDSRSVSPAEESPSSAHRARGGDGAPLAARDESVAVPSATPARIAVDATPADECATLEVLDPDGAVVPGAIAAVCEPDVRSIRRGSDSIVGRTDAAGSLALRKSWLATNQDRPIRVLHRDYLPAEVQPAALLDGWESISLSRGLTLRVRCVTIHGDPIRGALVVGSASAFDGWSEFLSPVDACPGPSPGARIHTAVSDVGGVALLTGLARATFGIAAYHTRYALVVAGDFDPHIRVPEQSELTVRFGPIVAFVGRFEGDEAVAWQARIGPEYASSGAADAMARLESARLVERFPGCVVLVAVQHEVAPAEPWRIPVVFARHEPETFHVGPIPVDDVREPVSLRPTGAPMPELPTAELVVLGPGGNRLDLPGLYVEPVQRSPIARFEVQPSRPLRLPAGRYRLRAPDRLVTACLQAEAFDVPGTNVASLTRDFRRCRVWCFAGSSGTLAAAQVQFEVADVGTSGTYVTSAAEPLEVWLPVGLCVARHSIAGNPLGESEFTVVAATSPEPQDVVLR